MFARVFIVERLAKILVLTRLAQLSCLCLLLAACSSAPVSRVIAVNSPVQSTTNPVHKSLNKSVPAIAALPAPARNVIKQARAAHHSGHFGKARALMTKAQRMAPQHPELYLIWGDLYAKQDAFNEAENMYQRALSLAPKNSAYYHQIRERLARL